MYRNLSEQIYNWYRLIQKIWRKLHSANVLKAYQAPVSIILWKHASWMMPFYPLIYEQYGNPNPVGFPGFKTMAFMVTSLIISPGLCGSVSKRMPWSRQPHYLGYYKATVGTGICENYGSGNLLDNGNPINLYQNVSETLLIAAPKTQTQRQSAMCASHTHTQLIQWETESHTF